MNRFYPIALMFIIGLLLPIQAFTEEPVINMDSVEKANPYSDACKAINESDFRFIAMKDKTICPPEIEQKGALEKYGYKIIDANMSSAIKDSYEYKRRLLIARLYISKYNDTILRELERIDSRQFMMKIEGVDVIKERFTWYEPIIGLVMPCKSQCFSIDLYLKDESQSLLNAARWHVPVANEQIEYDWNDFLKVFEQTNDILNKNTWLQEIKSEGPGRRVKVYIDGLIPNFDDISLEETKALWEKEGLPSEPYYEIYVRLGVNDTVLSGYISKDGKIVLIRQISTNDFFSKKILIKSNHWIFRRPLYYHPNNKESFYLVIDNENKTYYYSDKPKEIHHF